MRIYILIAFIINVIGIPLYALRLMFKTYPWSDEITLGEDVVRLIGAISFVAWTGYLLWGR